MKFFSSQSLTSRLVPSLVPSGVTLQVKRRQGVSGPQPQGEQIEPRNGYIAGSRPSRNCGKAVTKEPLMVRLWTTAGVVDGGTFPKELIGTWETQAGADIGSHSGVPLPDFQETAREV